MELLHQCTEIRMYLLSFSFCPSDSGNFSFELFKVLQVFGGKEKNIEPHIHGTSIFPFHQYRHFRFSFAECSYFSSREIYDGEASDFRMGMIKLHRNAALPEVQLPTIILHYIFFFFFPFIFFFFSFPSSSSVKAREASREI